MATVQSDGRRRGRLALLAGLALIAVILFLLLAAQRTGTPVGNFGSASANMDKAQIETIVHDYILAHPEIIPQAIGLLQEREVTNLLASNRDEIQTPFAGAWVGDPQGDVTLVELFDYACPYCRSAHEDLKRILKEDPDLKVVYRDFPVLSEESEQAALASLAAAKQGRYEAFHDALFQGSGRLTRERIIAAVRSAGMNEVQAVKDMQSAEIKAEIKKNRELAQAIGVTGTPTYVVGKQILAGAVGYDALKKAIAEARASSDG